MATHSISSLAWEIPWTEEPGGLQSMDSCGGCCSLGGQSWALGQLPVGLASGTGAGLLMGS